MVRRKVRTKRPKRAPRYVSAPVARSVSSTNRAGQSKLRKQGTDYITVVQGESWSDGETLFNLTVTPSLMPQMNKIAATFQKIKYHSLTFELSSHMPTSTAGGYIMAFVPDPADKLPSDIIRRKQHMVATPGSTKDSIWKSGRLQVLEGGGSSWNRCLPTDYLFTSQGNDIRLHSPGVFNVVVDGSVNQPGSLSLSIHWDATFHVESLEQSSEGNFSEELTNVIDLIAPDDGASLTTESDLNNAARWRQMFPTAPYPGPGYVYECELPVYAQTPHLDGYISVFTKYYITVDDPNGEPYFAVVTDPTVSAYDDTKFKAPHSGVFGQSVPEGQTWRLITIPTPTGNFRIPRLGLGSLMPNLRKLPNGGMTNCSY